MKSILTTINEATVNEAKLKYYEETLNMLANVLAIAPECQYNMDLSGDLRYAIMDFLEALRSDNEALNDASMNGKAEPSNDIQKLKTQFGKILADGLSKSCSVDYECNW